MTMSEWRWQLRSVAPPLLRSPPTRLLGILVSMAGLLSSTAPAQNLLVNPGFESGTSGWNGFGATLSSQTSEVHSESRAVRVENRSGNWGGVRQELDGVLVDGQRYHASAWVRLASGGSQPVKLTIRKTDDSGTSYGFVDTGTATSTGWTQLSGVYDVNISGTLTELFLYLEGPDATVDYYADDFVLESTTSGTATGDCVVAWNDVHQRIDGFGASSAWRSTWTEAQADLLFSTTNGVGLSLLRTRITPDVTTWESSIMQMARDRGARVWSAPWSPPIEYKDSGTVDGGNFVSSVANYQGYAGQLADYVLDMKTAYDVDLYALSVQNEPDHSPTTYEGCVWTPAQIREFVPYLHAALTSNGVSSTRIMLPEGMHWAHSNMYTEAMDDTNVAAMVDIIANHNYDGINGGPPMGSAEAIPTYGKALWETEVSKLSGDDPGIDDGVYWAGRVHLFMTVAEANAWHYWWLISANGTPNQGLVDGDGNPAKRLYTLGNFSKFVRPGFHRIGATMTGSQALVSAYKDPAGGAFAIVAVNPGEAGVELGVTLDGFTTASVVPWVTSASLSLDALPPVAVSASGFTHTVPAMSVVSYVGQAIGPPLPAAPVFASISTAPGAGGIHAAFTFDGDAGPDYRMMTSTNLSDWTVRMTTNLPALPAALMDPDPATAPTRFYRIEAVP